MEPLLVQYWGNSPLWREQTESWKKYYYFSAWHIHDGGCYIAPLKKVRHKTYDLLSRTYYVVPRGNWLVLTEDSITIYTDAEYQQLAGV